MFAGVLDPYFSILMGQCAQVANQLTVRAEKALDAKNAAAFRTCMKGLLYQIQQGQSVLSNTWYALGRHARFISSLLTTEIALTALSMNNMPTALYKKAAVLLKESLPAAYNQDREPTFTKLHEALTRATTEGAPYAALQPIIAGLFYAAPRHLTTYPDTTQKAMGAVLDRALLPAADQSFASALYKNATRRLFRQAPAATFEQLGQTFLFAAMTEKEGLGTTPLASTTETMLFGLGPELIAKDGLNKDIYRTLTEALPYAQKTAAATVAAAHILIQGAQDQTEISPGLALNGLVAAGNVLPATGPEAAPFAALFGDKLEAQHKNNDGFQLLQLQRLFLRANPGSALEDALCDEIFKRVARHLDENPNLGKDAVKTILLQASRPHQQGKAGYYYDRIMQAAYTGTPHQTFAELIHDTDDAIETNDSPLAYHAAQGLLNLVPQHVQKEPVATFEALDRLVTLYGTGPHEIGTHGLNPGFSAALKMASAFSDETRNRAPLVAKRVLKRILRVSSYTAPFYLHAQKALNNLNVPTLLQRLCGTPAP